jgi:GxxExxY protein
MTDLLYKDEVYAIIGAAMEVYNFLGPGFLEAVYQEAFEIELTDRNIPYSSQPKLPIRYKEYHLKKCYYADLLVFEKIIVEIKAQNRLAPSDQAQLLNELKVSQLGLGLLINFGSPNKLEWKRMILTYKYSSSHNKSFSNIIIND